MCTQRVSKFDVGVCTHGPWAPGWGAGPTRDTPPKPLPPYPTRSLLASHVRAGLQLLLRGCALSLAHGCTTGVSAAVTRVPGSPWRRQAPRPVARRPRNSPACWAGRACGSRRRCQARWVEFCTPFCLSTVRVLLCVRGSPPSRRRNAAGACGVQGADHHVGGLAAHVRGTQMRADVTWLRA